MCRETTAKDARPRLLLASVDSFCENGNSLPNKSALLVTAVFIVAFLCLSEVTWRQIIYSLKDMNPILEDETNRNILARHIGVDTTSCFICSYLGFKARHIMKDIYDSIFHFKPVPKAFENRMFKYYPETARISLFFMAYQIKNSYDTIVWNDGAIFVFHHILSLTTCWGSMFPGAGQYYAPFFFGVSEISTGILCLLANYDDTLGVDGLSEAFPLGKAVLGVLFAISFIICRVFLWSKFSYHYFTDAVNAIKGNTDPKLAGHLPWLRYYCVTLSCLTVLQIIWLGEIFIIGREEMVKMGYL
mmetsp:Transcript_21994/g.33595  ORF Transcript_21994/g.33595 Transcript_21994/m.33595 type:complete len:302 (-) Transcript_21994:117-1022(-)